jgi:hypothetical protein
MLRRTRLGLLAARELTGASSPQGVSDPVQCVADVLARELGWEAPRLEQELERIAAEAAAEGIVAETARAVSAGMQAPPAMP